MGRQSPYSEEFRRDAVALYRAAGGRRTYPQVAAELGVTAESLRTWVRKADGEGPAVAVDRGMGELARLRAENARLLRAEKEWQLEREILRRAAAYFAREVK